MESKNGPLRGTTAPANGILRRALNRRLYVLWKVTLSSIVIGLLLRYALPEVNHVQRQEQRAAKESLVELFQTHSERQHGYMNTLNAEQKTIIRISRRQESTKSTLTITGSNDAASYLLEAIEEDPLLLTVVLSPMRRR